MKCMDKNLNWAPHYLRQKNNIANISSNDLILLKIHFSDFGKHFLSLYIGIT